MNAQLTTPVRSPIIVGRALPLAHLELTLQQAQDGRGQVVILAGEAGVGKSRLVAELVARAQTKEFFILEGNCFEPDRPLPFAPLLDLLRNFLLTQSPEIFTDQPAAFAPDLGMLLPEIARYLPANQLPTPEPAQEKKRLFQSIFRCLTQVEPRTRARSWFRPLHP